jgi:hypothetical protein
MSDGVDLDPLYVAARRVLLDALVTLAPHGKAVIVVGAQAVYLRTGLTDVAIAIAPYTTDADLALDPSLLGDEPELEASMQQAGFKLAGPGSWATVNRVGDEDVRIPVDLMVPEAASTGKGTRGARLGVHGKRAARRAVGLEAALVDHGPLTIAALDPTDTREVTVEVAGVAALLVAKAHKIHDRVLAGKFDRISDKDASDVYRIMQTARPADVAETLRELLADPVAGPVTDQALSYMNELFGRRAGEGVAMAQRALRLAIAEAQVATLCVAFTEQILATPSQREES